MDANMKKLIAANWKMHKTGMEAHKLLSELDPFLNTLPTDREVAIFPPFTALAACANISPKRFQLGAQNCHYAKEGAFTGEISANMLKCAGCSKVLLGHSERRTLFHEDDVILGKKASTALEEGLGIVFCIGETLTEREAGRLRSVLARQLAVLPEIATDVSSHICIAYEPVWAIGTGKVAGLHEIVEAHEIVRNLLLARYGSDGKSVRILYGGGVKANNTGEIINLENVDGVLVGNASMNIDTFGKIILDW